MFAQSNKIIIRNISSLLHSSVANVAGCEGATPVNSIIPLSSIVNIETPESERQTEVQGTQQPSHWVARQPVERTAAAAMETEAALQSPKNN